MPSARLVIDIIFIALVVVAVSITAVTLARLVTDSFHTLEYATTPNPQEVGPRAIISDPDMNSLPDANNDPGMADQKLVQGSALIVTDAETGPLDHPVARYIYDSSPIVLPITWGAVAGTVIWRGKVRSRWSRQGYDYDMFRLVAKMRGSPTRVRLLNAVKDGHKNKLQLAKELGVDWKTVDNHAEMLVETRLIEENGMVGTARYYSITEGGRKILSLIAADELEE